MFFQPYNLNADAEYIRLGNNVVCASGVTFICHDVIHHMLNRLDDDFKEYNTYWGTIDVKDNVFIGANTTILPNVVIGSNTIIAAGSLINKDVPDGKIVGGVPARVIGDTSDLAEKRRIYSRTPFSKMSKSDRLLYLLRNK